MFSEERFNVSNTALSYVNTVVTLLGVIWAVWTAAWHLSVQRATKHLGPICRDKDLMGFFVVKAPRWWWAIFPFFGIPRVDIPLIPSVSALIEAGDDGVFTSSMFNSILPDRRKISWNAVYERFFVEYAWKLALSGLNGAAPLRRDSWDPNGDLRKYQKRAEEAVWYEIRWAEGMHTALIFKAMHFLYKYFGLFKKAHTKTLSVSRDRIPYLDRHLLYCRWDIHKPVKEWWERNVEDQMTHGTPLKYGRVGPILIKCQLDLLSPEGGTMYDSPKGTAATNTTETAEIKAISEKAEDDLGPYPDMELAAYGQAGHLARIPNLISRASTKFKPVSRTITQIRAALEGKFVSEDEGYRLSWTIDLQPLWIHGDAPCIEVSEDELGGLALAMGITLKLDDKDSLPSGPSAFGASLTSTSDGSMTKLKFAFGLWQQRWYWAGSGYQTMFARFMACSCLPFAREPANFKIFEEVGTTNETVHAVEVTSDVVEGIKNGDHISVGPRGCSYSSPASEYLDRLPSSPICYLYDTVIPGRDGKQGLIQRQNGQDVGWWCTAVAGIAFGGLVPMAGEHLIDAVKFTVGGGIEIEDFDALEELVSVIMKSTKMEVGHPFLRLFGVPREIDDELNKSNDKVDNGSILDKSQPVRDIVEVLARYNTLLERLTAMVLSEYPDEEEWSLPRSIFNKCRSDIRQCYSAACKKYRTSKGLEKNEGKLLNAVEGKRNEERPLEDLLRALSPKEEAPAADEQKRPPAVQKKRPTVDDCALVARHIIKVWTSVVKVVDWSGPAQDDTGNIKSGGIQNDIKGADDVYKPIPFAKLPDVALWE